MESRKRPSDIRNKLEHHALSHQNGVITHADAFAAGLTRSQLNWSRHSKRWVPGPARGTLLLAHRIDDDLSRLTSATLGFDAVAWGPSSLAVWALGDYPDVPIVATTRQAQSSGAKVVYTPDVLNIPRTKRQGVPTVSLEYAIASSAQFLALPEFNETIDAALRDRLTTWDRVADALKFFTQNKRRGNPVRQAALQAREIDSTPPLSRWSRDFADKLVRSGLPLPNMEWRVADDTGALVAQVDLAYPDKHYAIELDSIAYHFDTESFESDRRRDGDLFRSGWRVSRFTWNQYIKHWPEVIATIKAGLR